jgi:hypothetical protein
LFEIASLDNFSGLSFILSKSETSQVNHKNTSFFCSLIGILQHEITIKNNKETEIKNELW